MADSIFIEDSNILRYLQIRQKILKKIQKEMPDKIKFGEPVGLEEFM